MTIKTLKHMDFRLILARVAAAVTYPPIAFLGSLVHAACIVQPTRGDFSTVELGDMVQRAGVNKLHTAAARISVHIGDFRHDANLLRNIRRLDEITHYTPLNREDEEWLAQHRFTFSVSSRSFSYRILFPLTFSFPLGVFYPSARMVPPKYP